MWAKAIMLLLNDRQKEERKGKKKRKEEGYKQEAKMKRNQSDKVKKERTATIQLENKNNKKWPLILLYSISEKLVLH